MTGRNFQYLNLLALYYQKQQIGMHKSYMVSDMEVNGLPSSLSWWLSADGSVSYIENIIIYDVIWQEVLLSV